MDLLDHYRAMARMRAVELGLAELWHRGLAPGEMHLGTGEEALISGVLAHRGPADYFAIDHRASTVMTGLGVPSRDILAECVGRDEGLCRGRGGHMHLYSQEFHAAASGIVGSAAPAAVGFALASQLRDDGGVAFAFFGDGAINQGMVLESFNLAAAWSLPLLFVCKDNGWAIATRSEKVTGGELCARARGFGLRAEEVDGTDPEAVDALAGKLVHDVRRGKGPAFLRARVARLDGHLLGDPLVRVSKEPTSERAMETTRELLSGLFAKRGGAPIDRARSLGSMLGLMIKARSEGRDDRHDPLVRVRKKVARAHAQEADAIDQGLVEEVADVIHGITDGGAS
jgi:pyruvate dehydrogenase E1 component alpha subunit